MTESRAKRILIVAGEASGDLHGASLAAELKQAAGDVDLVGIGGDRMAAQGVRLGFHVKDLAVVGIVEVLAILPRLYHAYRWLMRELRGNPPDVVVLIDYAEFNLFFAGRVRKRGIPVVFYISPQIWAWRRGRVRRIARNVDEMVVILPFERDFYKEHGVKVSFVGHPLVEQLGTLPEIMGKSDDKEAFVVGWMPGSRDSEVNRLLPVMSKAAAILESHARRKVLHVVPVAPGMSPEKISRVFSAEGVSVETHLGNASDIMRRCDLIILASGTATLEAALLGIPAIIVYKVSFFSAFLGWLLIRVPWIGLANIVAGKEVYPELVQYKATPKRIAETSIRLLEDPDKLYQIRNELKKIREKLGKPGASRRTAEVISRYAAAISA